MKRDENTSTQIERRAARGVNVDLTRAVEVTRDGRFFAYVGGWGSTPDPTPVRELLAVPNLVAELARLRALHAEQLTALKAVLTACRTTEYRGPLSHAQIADMVAAALAKAESNAAAKGLEIFGFDENGNPKARAAGLGDVLTQALSEAEER